MRKRKRVCPALSLLLRLPVELRRVVLRLVGTLPLSDGGGDVDGATIMWLRDQVVLVPRVLYVVTPVHTWYVDGSRRRDVMDVRRIYRRGAKSGHAISRLHIDKARKNPFDRRPSVRSVAVHYSGVGRMRVECVDGEVTSRPRGLAEPRWLLV